MRTRTPVRTAATIAALALLASAHVATAQTALPAVQVTAPAVPYVMASPPPSNGLALLITGAALTGVGVLDAATAPLCFPLLAGSGSFFVGSSTLQDTCLATSLVVAGVILAVGVPLLIVGVGQRNRYAVWRRQHPWVGLLDSVGVFAGQGGGSLSLRVAF